MVIALVGGAAFAAGWLLHFPIPAADSAQHPPLEPITAQADIKRTYNVGIGPVSGIAYSPDGRLLAATTSDGRVIVQDTVSGSELNNSRTPEVTGAATGVTFSPDGKTYAVSTSSGSVLLLQVHGSREPAVLSPPPGRKSAVTSAAYSPGGQTLAVANSQGIVQLWDVSRETPAVLAAPGRHHSVTDVAFDSQDTTLAVASIDGTVQLWDVRAPSTPEVLSTLERGRPVTSVGYSPDGSVLAAGSSDGTTKFWNVKSPDAPLPYDKVSTRPLPGGVGSITGLVFTDSSRIAASTAGGYVQVWDIDKSPRLLHAPSRSEAFTSLSYNAARSTLAVGTTDGTVQVWAADTTAGRARR
ncbi:WD40 repeat domain-containing protein [Streptomyces sp. NPDC050535]|uniref:WD40 repeat domain-containing protein n=1 Tax=Streptomyces sp. NPDC050535 TaxID=3365626 RepID=UPI0037B4B391